MGLSKLDYWVRLKKLRLLSLQRRREWYNITNAWKILNGGGPNNIGMAFYSSSRLGVRASISTYSYKAQKYMFSVKAARLLNSLPKKVKEIKTLEPFKVALGEFLAKHPDQPPVTWYTPPNSNSLLDWSAAGEIEVCA